MLNNNTNFLSKEIIDKFACENILKDFVNIFYDFVYSPDDKTLVLEKYLKISENFLEFMQNRLPKEAKLRIFQPSVIEHGFELNNLIIEIVSDDVSFLAESVSKEIAKLGLNIYRVIHSTVEVERSSYGDLQSIKASKSNFKNKESLLYFEISNNVAANVISDLNQKILKLINELSVLSGDLPKVLEEKQSLFIEDKISLKDELLHQEVREFFSWTEKNFTFLGFCDLKLEKDGLDILRSLGISSHIDKNIMVKLFEDLGSNKQLYSENDLENYVEIGRLNFQSSINEGKNLFYIGLKDFDDFSNLRGIKLFTGIFSDHLSYQTVFEIPLIRWKINNILNKSQVSSNNFSNKILKDIVEDLPKEELFQIGQNRLMDLMRSISDLILQPKVKLFSFKDKTKKFVSNLVFVPKENCTYDLAEKISEFLKSVFGGSIEKAAIKLDNSRVAYFYIVLNSELFQDEDLDFSKIEKRLSILTHRWLDDLHNALTTKYDKSEAKELYEKYKDAFPSAYKEKFPVDPSALKDLSFIEKACSNKDAVFDLYKLKDDPENIFRLKIYTSDKKVLLYQIIPVIKNLGLEPLESNTYRITPNLARAIWVNDYYLSLSLKIMPKITDIKLNVQEALRRIWQDLMHNDGFNKLLISASFNWQEVRMVRALVKYMKQVGISYSQQLIENSVNDHPDIVAEIFRLFDIYFNPHNRTDVAERGTRTEKNIEEKLNLIVSDVDDKILRNLYLTVKAILRTNYYRTLDGKPYDYISFKFNSAKVPDSPEPRPLREIFFHSKKAKGIHLRAGKVARGGIRWSDRIEDFRTEVLGLMKAQNTKNSVIVPVGSKGGFVLTDDSDISGDNLFNEAVEAYKNYLRSMLDITDNIIDGNIIPPQNVVRLDGDDPYLVVAADKGTASFSDIANNIAKEYNFWLGDAFASGGSAGYDHKKMGITSRGAWISVTRHFREMNIDVQNEDFTVLGIGDMSGDVFGNGMLSSRFINLIAAFNHSHIFIDPNPNREISFIERKRLFEKPRSSWADYNRELISVGGGVFERKAKFIEISPEIKAKFAIIEDKLHPNQLIKHLLKSEYDLLWNGGIGVYIKATSESNAEVGDKSNDLLRVNGNELNCKVIGEGGNLGVTQLGRIEYASKNGRINTDSVDNSGGVDCSDHEVNIKITFQKASENNKITLVERNKLLAEMTEEVASLVLIDNYKQTQAISIASVNNKDLLPLHMRLIEKLEERQILNRHIEFLPQKNDLAKRFHEKSGLTRPEISVLLAYSKIEIYGQIVNSNLPDDNNFDKYLFQYFPKIMQEKFKDEILLHPLKREIVSTVITNEVVNRMGSHFFNLVLEDTGLPGCDIIRAYILATEIFQIDKLWKKIEILDGKIDIVVQVEIFNEIIEFTHNNILWLLRNFAQPLKFDEDIKKLSHTITEFSLNIENFAKKDLEDHEQNRLNYLSREVPEDIAKSLDELSVLGYGFDISLIKMKTSISLDEVTKIYFQISDRLNYNWLKQRLETLPSTSFWEELSIKTLKQDLSDKLREIIINFIELSCNFSSWSEDKKKHLDRYDQLISNLMNIQIVDISMLIIVIKRLDFLLV